MRAVPSLCLLLLAAALAVPLAASAQKAPAQKKVRVAVLDIRPLGTESAKAELLSEVALTEASSMPGFEVIGKSDINSIIGFEKQKKVIGCGDDSSCLAEIGGALGVDFILVGSVGAIEDLYRLDLKLVETKKAKVRARVGVTVEGKERKLVAAIQKAVHDLLGPETPKEQPVAQPHPADLAAAAPLAAASAAAAKAGPTPAAKAEQLKAAPAKSTAPPATTGVSTSAGMSRRTWSYVAGGTGLALLAGGLVAGLGAKSAYDKEKDAAAAGDVPTYESQKDKVKSLSTTADILFLTGAVGVGVGTYLWFTSRPPALAVNVAPLPGGAVASISGGF